MKKRRSSLKHTQATLVHVPVVRDVVYTPRWLSRAIVEHFAPDGTCLDPCRGDGAFYDFLPDPKDWCEIEDGRDFFAYNKHADWIIGNPPYEGLLGWFRHSFAIADNVVFLVPLHRVMSSGKFIDDVFDYGGLAEVFVIGTGTTAGFPFGHCLAAVHYKKCYRGGTKWSKWDET